MFIGEGSYGKVYVKDNKAVKKFAKLSHVIQEYVALKYLEGCSYIVHTKGVDFANLELHMELYDTSLRKWLWFEDKTTRDGRKHSEIMKVTHDVLCGLVELHDRELAHGDIKPGNILIQRNPLKAVLGDCGFVSIAKYAKVERTADVYRDPIVDHETSHDMYSFGIVFLEMIGGIKMSKQASYNQVRQLITEKVEDESYKRILLSLTHPDKSKRPTSRYVLLKLFNEDPPRWGKNKHVSSSYQLSSMDNEKDNKHIKNSMRTVSRKFNINRAKKGYVALVSYIDNHTINMKMHNNYIHVTLMILSALFGRSGFRLEDVMDACPNQKSTLFYDILDALMRDAAFIHLLLSP
jgi:serine/threonine protein kinase